MNKRLILTVCLLCTCLIAGSLTLQASGDKQQKQTRESASLSQADLIQADRYELIQHDTRAVAPRNEAKATASASGGVNLEEMLEMKESTTDELSPRASFKQPAATDDISTLPARTRNNNSLDDACTQSLGAGLNALITNWGAGDGNFRYVDPADCPTNPGYPFLIEDIDFYGISAAVTSGCATGVGTLTYRVGVFCVDGDASDPCNGVGAPIFITGSQTFEFTTANETSVVLFSATAIDVCVQEPFFVGFLFDGWTGDPSCTPSVLYDVDEAGTPDCVSPLLFGGTYYDPSVVGYGSHNVDVTGNTQDTCTPFNCSTITGACCNTSTGVCTPDVSSDACVGPYDVFTPNATCEEVTCDDCGDPLPNDDCASAVALTSGSQVCNSTACLGVFCEDDIPAVWYSVTLTEACSDLTVDYCGSTSGVINAYLNIFDDCLCNGGGAIGADRFNVDDCGDGNVTLFYYDLPAGTYYIAVHPDLLSNYCITATWQACPPCVPDDNTTLADYNCEEVTLSGTTVGAGDECHDLLAEEYIYEITPMTDMRVNIDGCTVVDPGGEWDMVLLLSEDCCASTDVICLDDDGCGTVAGQSSIECCDLFAGNTYYLHVTGLTEADAGQFELNISCCAPCDLTCDPTLDPEGEPDCATDYVDATNGGCNSDPVAFLPVLCDDGYCGTSGVFDVSPDLLGRDQDYYRYEGTTEQLVTATVTSEFSYDFFLYEISADCQTVTLVEAWLDVPACTTRALTHCLPPYDEVNGPWYVYMVQPFDFIENIPCGREYEISWTCAPCDDCTQATACDTPVEDEASNDVCDTGLITDALGCDESLNGAICERGDIDYIVLDFAAPIEGVTEVSVEILSGPNCDDTEVNVIGRLLDENCHELVGFSTGYSITLVAAATYVLELQGVHQLIEHNWQVNVTCEACYDACDSAPELTFGTPELVNTCDGCLLYAATGSEDCADFFGSGPQIFRSFTLTEASAVSVALVGDPDSETGSDDVQFTVLSDCGDVTSCVCSQDQNFPGGENPTGEGHEEFGTCILGPGTYYVGVSAWSTSNTLCGEMTLTVDVCNAVQDLTVALNPLDDTQAILRWTAPQNSEWRIFRTTNPNHGLDIAGEFSFVASVNGTGGLEYIDTDPLAPYVNYVVVPACALTGP